VTANRKTVRDPVAAILHVGHREKMDPSPSTVSCKPHCTNRNYGYYRRTERDPFGSMETSSLAEQLSRYSESVAARIRCSTKRWASPRISSSSVGAGRGECNKP